jgi:hypothetical protein
MRGKSYDKQTLAQLHVSIEVDAEGALHELAALIHDARSVDPAFVRLEADLLKILAAARHARRVEARVTQLLAGPLVGEDSEAVPWPECRS